jgi:glycosyltransferase involved in cell wall biosynthesis
LRVAILVTHFPPRFLAGTEISTYNVAKYLAKRGHEVHVITLLDNGLTKESLEDGFFVHRIYVPKVKHLALALYIVKELLLIKRLNPEIIHAQTISRGLACILAKKLLRKPCVVWGRGSDIYLPWRFKVFTSKLVLVNADALLALTEHMKKKMIELIGKERRDIFVIPNGIDLSLFDNNARKITTHSLKAGENERIILYVGRLEPIKGVRYLIQAMKILKNKGIANVKLLILGEGRERKYLEDLVIRLDLKDRVIFVGKVPHHDIPVYMASADIFVLPSLSEGFPGVILEAMAMGLPVIATRVTGLPEIIQDGENGFLVEPYNSIDMAEKITLLLADISLREKISRNNKEKVKDYNWNEIIKKLENVYLYVLNKKEIVFKKNSAG